MKKVLVFMMMALAIVAFAGFSIAAPGNGNSLKEHKKITGDVKWTSAGGVENLRTVFSVHLNAPGKNSIRGTVTLYNPNGDMRVMEVDDVIIEDNEAWISGEIVQATGVYSSYEGKRDFHWVKDAGTPGREGDLIGAWIGHDNLMGQWTGGGTVTSGNLKVH